MVWKTSVHITSVWFCSKQMWSFIFHLQDCLSHSLLVYVDDIKSILPLENHNTFIWLSYLNTKKVFKTPKVFNLKMTRQVFIQLGNLSIIISCDDYIININNKIDTFSRRCMAIKNWMTCFILFQRKTLNITEFFKPCSWRLFEPVEGPTKLTN